MAPVDPPTLALDVDDLVDWLEFMALFDPFGVARFDSLLGSLTGLEETPEDNIGERDRRREQLIERLENEIDFRRRELKEAYPFDISPTGEELILSEGWDQPVFTFYLICLVTSHVAGSAILRTPPAGDLLTELRNRIFQIVATLGMAGLSAGPAFSVGWPRRRGETIIELLGRAAAAGGGFDVRNPPGRYVSPHEKDGGVDVIAWSFDGRPPPAAFYFGQTASGKNWPGKPVSEHARTFCGAYMVDHMTGNYVYVTLVPYRILDEAFWNTQCQFHRGILDRSRLPLRAWQGFQLAQTGTPVDHADQLAELGQWLQEFMDYAITA